MNQVCRITVSLLTAITVFSPAVGAVTSKDHPVLIRTLRQHPDADADKDGVLTFAEYTDFVVRQGPRKLANGRPAGPISTLLASGDLLIADFEENNLGRMRDWGWGIEGEAFGRDLGTGTRIMKRRVRSFRGKYLLTSMVASDAQEGRILSPEFAVELKYIKVVMSGGMHPHRVCVNVLVDDSVVRTVTGRNDDVLETVAFDVGDLKGRQARVEVVDAYRGVWGHVNVDWIYQSDNARAERTISVAPVGYGEPVGRFLTMDGNRRRGRSKIYQGTLRVEDQSINLGSLLLAVCDQEPAQRDTGSQIRLINGEIWQARILGFAKGRVAIESPLFGQRNVPIAEIASLEFIPGASDSGVPGTLYRVGGEPIPGKLVWIREKDLAIDCPLGIVPVPRQTLQRFVIADLDRSSKRSPDEVSLADGSLLRGRLSVETDKLSLVHATLGPLRIPWNAVRYVRRSPDQAHWIGQLEETVVEQVGLVLSPPPPRFFDAVESGYLRALQILPRTRVSYRLPAEEGATHEFRAQLAPVAGCRTDVMVNVLADGRPVWEYQIGPESKPVSVAVDLSDAVEMTIVVDFGKRFAFPCAANWYDAHVITVSKNKK